MKNFEDYEVVWISTYGDSEEVPEIRANNEKYPEIVQYVKEEQETYVVNRRTRKFDIADDFFQIHRVKTFTVTEHG